MFEIGIRSVLTIIVTKLTKFLAVKLFKGGSNFPGKVALKLDSNILKKVSKNYKVILVTGTNGKTTTTSMIYNVLKENKFDVITNSTGANMYTGIISTFIDNYKFSNNKERYAVIEVDEANVKFITEHVTPEVITITNLFRDQLDRYGEVYTTLNKILEGINKVPATTLLLNGDESLLGKLDVKNPVKYYGFDVSPNKDKKIEVNADAKFCKFCKTSYEYNFITYNHLGDFYCPNCGFKRPHLDYAMNEILELTPDGSKIKINNSIFTVTQSGLYNIYNALCAYGIAKEFNVSDSVIEDSFTKQDSSFGRQENLSINGKDVKIILVKNPAGYNQALDTLCLNSNSFSAAFLLNDRYADGRDVSWLWDVDFEKLKNMDIKEVFVSGVRKYDMAVRLKVAGLDPSSFIVNETFEDLTTTIENCKENRVYILATYTAMIDYRKYLHSKGYIEKLW
ncbi:MAG: MurT ligase domain-containing protein [Sarcina sp.]